MAFYLSPLVDVREIDLTTTIPAVATSIGVIALRNTFKGPENTKFLVADEADLLRAFGEPTNDMANYQDWLSAANFLKYGNKLYCTRVMPVDARFGTNKLSTFTSGGSGLMVTITVDSGGVITGITGISAGTGYAKGEFVTITGGNAIAQVTSESAGVPSAVALVSAGSKAGGIYTAGSKATVSKKVASAPLTTGGQGLELTYGDEAAVVATVGAPTGTLTTSTSFVAGTYTVTVDGSAVGTNLELDITIDGSGAVTATVVADGGAGFVIGETASVLFSDLTGSGADGGGPLVYTVTGLTPNAAGVLDAGEVTLVSGGIRYVAGQEYDVIGPDGEGGVIEILTVDAAGAVLTFDVTSGGTGYTAGTLELVVSSGYDLPTGTLEDLPSGLTVDFGDDFSVTSGDLLWFIAASRGNWGDNIRIGILNKTTQTSYLNGTAAAIPGQPSESFKYIDSRLDSDTDLLILVQAKDQRKSTWVTKEVWNVSVNVDAIDDTGNPRYIEKVLNEASQYIRAAVSEDLACNSDSLTSELSAAAAELAKLAADVWYDFDDGYDGVAAISDGDIIEAYGLYENPEDVDANIFIDSGKSETVKSELISICQDKRKDAMCVLDVPKNLVYNNTGMEAESLRDWRNGTGAYSAGGFNENSSYAAIYANWLEVYDKYNQKYRWIPASGVVAGIYAKTDNIADPWWAPAGLNRAVLTGVRRLAWNPKLGYRDMLYSNGLNPIVSFAGEGKVIWGQKTMLSKESAFNRVNIRRLFLVLEKAIATAAKYFLFEPNDPITRNLLVNMIEPFLRDVQARRGIYDFKVVCNEINNTAERVDRNELWCNIFIKPTRTAEFIVLNFVATKTGASFDEAAKAVA